MGIEYGSNRPRLDTRLEGLHRICPQGISIHYYEFNHEAPIREILFNGLELLAPNANIGDNISLWTEYYVPPLNVWKRYKKFGKNYMVFPNIMQKHILFPTKPSVGVRLVIQYNNTGTANVDFLINLFNFVDLQKVNTSALLEGYDW